MSSTETVLVGSAGFTSFTHLSSSVESGMLACDSWGHKASTVFLVLFPFSAGAEDCAMCHLFFCHLFLTAPAISWPPAKASTHRKVLARVMHCQLSTPLLFIGNGIVPRYANLFLRQEVSMPSARSTTHARQLEEEIVLCLDLRPFRVFLCTKGFAVLNTAR